MRRLVRAAALAAASAAAVGPAGAMMSFSFRVPTLSGGVISDEDLKGKIVIVDVWATWCGPCRLVIPHLVALQDKFRKDGIAVVGLNADETSDTSEGKKAIGKFAAQAGINYPIGLMNDRAYAEVYRVMGFDPSEGFSLPSTIVLARDGTVMKRYPGYFPGQEREIEKLITRMLEAEKPHTPPARH